MSLCTVEGLKRAAENMAFSQINMTPRESVGYVHRLTQVGNPNRDALSLADVKRHHRHC